MTAPLPPALATDLPAAPLLQRALLIRRAEERLLQLFADGELSGTVHCCIGQELVGAALGEVLIRDDTVFSNHRCHGHYLGAGHDLEGLFAEIMGRRDGGCGGLGGSQHLHRDGFYSGGILGGLVPIAAGAGMAHRLDASPGIAVAVIGDGTLGEGVLYETMNLAALWHLPLLLVLERNGVAQSTDTHTTTAGTAAGRAEAFAIPVVETSTGDPAALSAATAHAARTVRSGAGPVMLIIDTFRLAPHSKGDDHRDPARIAAGWSRDPLQRALDQGGETVAALDRAARERVTQAVETARASPRPDPAVLLARPADPKPARFHRMAATDGRRVVTALRDGLKALLDADPGMLLLGEDVEDPYGGAFMATAGLSTLFPGRVRNTPISEAAIVGVGTGLALGGRRALVEIMFGDFVLLAADQLINQAAKLRTVYGAAGPGRLIVRTPMGGHRGYGPTHSQTLDRHLFGVPGLRVAALHSLLDPLTVYRGLLDADGDPAVVLENKLLYGRRLGAGLPEGFIAWQTADALPTVRVAADDTTADVTLIGYGGMLDDLLTAADRLFAEHDVLAQVLCPAQIFPFDLGPLRPLLAGGRAIVVAEEGQGFAGFGAEVLAQLAERPVAGSPRLARVAAAPVPIPAAPSLERAVLPTADSVVAATLEVLHSAG
ncbi:thiamine pyrophosphate-dependent enzyme [Micromonospora sp. LOL_023]|uniref:thiamine pyrophosphate-dependent enzyme n=1 Tax=Micromonospora sp. LOL_023 TaxID=3345418 RepID=UPI003A89858C